ncbi:hypothetical protein LWI28_000241 [Acer negundo]|uniref:DCD domain-containing protein n=1 Tax=Acer negundo TaxID=4023 RepID=A0AAD5I4W8_ACENE|nr:hypothetical protein LWI28_000241 [Acer negundo]
MRRVCTSTLHSSHLLLSRYVTLASSVYFHFALLVKNTVSDALLHKPLLAPYDSLSLSLCFVVFSSLLSLSVSAHFHCLPGAHFHYIKKVDPGLPLFLFNYSNRKLHGIFEAASPGQMYINPYGWTVDGSERTLYPAQVQVRVRMQCQPLVEDQFRPIIADNYYNHHHFWFELDHAQASKLMSLLASVAVAPSSVAPSSFVPENTARRTFFQLVPSTDKKEESEGCRPLALEEHVKRSSWASDAPDSDTSVDEEEAEDELFRLMASEFEHFRESDSTGNASLDGHYQHLEAHSQDEEDLILGKLKSLVFGHEHQDFSLTAYEHEHADNKDKHLEDEDPISKRVNFTENNEYSCSSSHCQSTIAELLREVGELKTFKTEQTLKMSFLELKLVQAEKEIQLLKDQCEMVETPSSSSMAQTDIKVIHPLEELHLDPTESIYLVGGYNGESWLSTMESYFPTYDESKFFKPMNSVRSYASVARLNGELYVLGGGDGHLWYDTVELYNPVDDEWTSCPPLNGKKGSLAGAAMNDKIFAIGGGNGVDCFSEVEMLDLDIGRWIRTRSMLQKRFALAAVEHNGALYATGGFDGNEYLNSAERFDPREHSWTRIANMNSRRGCHSLAVLNEKIYALGGFNGEKMVPSVEIYDPRLGTWIDGEPMNQPRGYSAAAVVKDSLYVIGGVRAGNEIVNTVEQYKEGLSWEEKISKVIGKRCFMTAIAFC